MNDMLATIVPKSDQLNYDDLTEGRTLTITVTKVGIKMDEQPVAISYEGDAGKPYKPGKSMRRVLVHCWGADATKYVGRSMTLYGDPTVKFGGGEVGGIRISHLSHIDRQMTMALTATKAVRKPFTVRPLVQEQAPTKQPTTLSDWIATTLPGFISECATPADLDKLTASRVYVAALGKADDAQKAEMGALIDGARGKLEADALTPELADMKTDAEVVAWRISKDTKEKMAAMSDEARALVEAAIEARRGELNHAQGSLA